LNDNFYHSLNKKALKVLFSNTGKPLGGMGVEAEAGKGGG